MRYLGLFFVILCGLSLQANAAEYQVQKDESRIAFSGTHAGDEFNGVFEEWDADISFDADNLEASSVTVTIQTESAVTGNAMYDGTLPNADWFDIKNHPTAIFQSQEFLKIDEGFNVVGVLTIRNIAKPAIFDFTLEGENPMTMQASFPLNRLEYDIGKQSDPSADWVSEVIVIRIFMKAK
jgi:polyisoprenoid-binding protein YceI